MQKNRSILFRLNAGNKYGLGHLSRNLVLANELKRNKYNCSFLIRTDNKIKISTFLNTKKIDEFDLQINEDHEFNDLNWIYRTYFPNYDFLILDHYDHDYSYQEYLRAKGIVWAQYDYQQTKKIISQIVINPNIGVKRENYEGMVSDETDLCVGEAYSLIDDSFKRIRRIEKIKDRIVISMGGGEYPQSVIEILTLLAKNYPFSFDIITSDDNVFKALGSYNNVSIFNNPPNLCDIFQRCELAVVAGGVTTYELAYLDVPMLIVPYANNQVRNSQKWGETDNAIGFNSTKEFKDILLNEELRDIIKLLIEKFKKRHNLIDGKGASRIVDSIKNRLNESKN